MSEHKKRRTLTPKVKRYLIAAVVIIAIALLAYAEVIRPNQDAKSYTARIESASTPLDKCFQNLADTTQQDIFFAPDIDFATKQKDVKTIQDHVAICRTQLASFNTTAHDLLALHLAGYTTTYREAQVNQRHAINMVSQSSDVLNQYQAMADFLSQYYVHVGNFLNAFDALNAAEDKGTVSNANKKLSNQATALRADAVAMRALKAPTGLSPSKYDAATMLEQAATGFENLARGLDSGSDYYTSLGYKQLDDVLSSYDNKIIGQPYDVIKGSYVLKQINDLPSKVENLLAAETE